ncbi:oxidoreductase [Novosphingobium umbonatum]|uniref:Oxidoreductase n=1 Tax=Novosphingobium umbonatum TaxID=1908524 RepID=A0A3S2VBW5_9SPHN|nr:GPW/gp25 family protein [Novosphingobium umbonatum]RVU03922.1 oxidoreductase [Novosphingobium umbonatum]
MIGMDASTGKSLSGTAHLAQSLGDILSTPLGTRLMRRDYGSALFSLIDRPLNAATAMLMRAAVVDAIAKWETRVTITKVGISGAFAAGNLVITITGKVGAAASTSLQTLSIPIRAASSAS